MIARLGRAIAASADSAYSRMMHLRSDRERNLLGPDIKVVGRLFLGSEEWIIYAYPQEMKEPHRAAEYHSKELRTAGTLNELLSDIGREYRRKIHG